MKQSWKLWAVQCLAAAVVCADPIPGAKEGWTAGLSGWSDRDPGEMFVIYEAAGNPAGSLAGDFYPSFAPEADAFRAGTNASGGAFTGNYRAQYARIAGWRFAVRAADVLPSSLTVRFGRGDTNFFRSVLAQIPTTGAWHTVFVPLDTPADWSGPAGGFTHTLAAMDFVEIQVVRGSANAERYQIDNFELVSLVPAAVSHGFAGGRPSSITWSGVKVGGSYVVESASSLTGAWSVVTGFVATNPLTAWPVPATNTAQQFYRLTIVDPAM